MNSASIRFRLAAWYFCSVAVILTLFGVGAWLAMNASVREAVDQDLRRRLHDVSEFTERQLAVGPRELIEELHEETLLGLGAGLLQLSDAGGQVLYRSPRLARFELPVRRPGSAGETIVYTTQSSGASSLRVAFQSILVKGSRFTVLVAEPLDEFAESLRRFRGLLLILGPLSLLLVGAGGYWIGSRALAPVDRITREARSIGITNLSTRLVLPPARDELQRLTVTLNDMLERIDLAVRRIVQFTADASHELRAPLTLIHVAAEFSLRRERTRDELVDAMQKILRESTRTARLVNELLLLARADSGTDGLQLVPLDVGDTGRGAIEQAVTLAEPRNITVSAEMPQQQVIVNGDEQALARLWLILLDNAVKYTNEGGRVTFALRVSNAHAEVLVSDTGIGIAAPDLPLVYDRFWRADKVRSRSLGGAGLGLSIARSIVDRHGGVISINSEPGHGSQVLVCLPVLPPPHGSL